MRAVLYAVASFAALAFAQIQSHDPNPPVLNPHSGTTWTVGATETVTWDTTGIITTDPAGRQLTGKVVLGYLKSDGQFLYQSTPIAQGFLIAQKQAQVVVPEVPSGKYFIALEGDTGNWSQLFTITNPSEPSGTPPTSIAVTPVSSGAAASSTTSSGSASSTTATSASASTTSAPSESSTQSGLSSTTSAAESSVPSTSVSSASTSGTATAPPLSASTTTGSSSSSLATVLSSSSGSSAAPSGTNAPNSAWSARGAGVGVVILPALGFLAAGIVL
ncbi:hypothetical protein BV20DRAFT_964658 [Pilatotrama ljubarskyi]|nr:hypothetical protein BV20DRAFT_964658 [Pilatotrama ljubarskyi]